MNAPKRQHSLPAHHKDLLLQGFCSEAPQVFARAFGPRCCIQASRATLEVLRAFGIHAHAVPVKLMAIYGLGKLVFNLGSSPKELEAAGQTILPQEFDTRGWEGHLVVVLDEEVQGARWLMDPSFDQVIHGFKEYGVKLSWQPKIEMIPLGKSFDAKEPIRWTVRIAGQDPLIVQYTITKDESFLGDENWQRKGSESVISLLIERLHRGLAIRT